MQPGDLEAIAVPTDFLGVNYYFPEIIENAPGHAPLSARVLPPAPDAETTYMGWEVAPQGLAELLLRIENDYVTAIEGPGVDAELMRSYIAAWGDREAYAVSHVGYGLNAAARWDSMALYDKRDFNGTELRAFAGNFLYSTGANEVAGRHTRGHFDLPLRGCTVTLDGQPVIDQGHLA